MKRRSNSESMRALSKLYRIEADRMELRDPPEIEVLKAKLRAVQSSRDNLDQEIKNRAYRPESNPGIAHDRALKILTVTFALTALLGFSSALYFGAPTQSPLNTSVEPLKIPESPFAPRPKVAPPASSKTLDKPSTAAQPRNAKQPKRHTPEKKHGGDKPGKGKTERDGKAGAKKPPKKDGFEFFDKCGMDPMCGFDKKSE